MDEPIRALKVSPGCSIATFLCSYSGVQRTFDSGDGDEVETRGRDGPKHWKRKSGGPGKDGGGLGSLG